MVTTILLVWTVVAAHGDRYHGSKLYDWRPLAEFNSPEACRRTVAELKLEQRSRCVTK